MGRIAVAAVVSLWVIPISVLVDRVVPDPYMDEIFHIPQAQRYCRGDFGTWDPMITTPPGLYYLSLVYIASLFPSMWFAKFASTMSSICSAEILRSTNAFVAVICSVLIYDLLIQLRPTLDEKKATIYAILLASYPLHWFFTFLYYTDVASLTAVLAMYLASLKRKYWLSAMLGALATMFRQTNIIWMFFIAANSAVSYAETLYGQDSVLQNKHKTMLEDNDLLSDNRSTPISSGLRKRRMHNSSSNSQQSVFERSKFSLHHPPGAKEAHPVSPHFAQMLYFGLCCAAALGPVHFTQATCLYQSFRKNKIFYSFQVLLALVIGFIAVFFFSIAHPYLLADNRHYPFYLWRKVIQVHWLMKYLLIPLYVYSWSFIISILGERQRRIWVLSYVIATALVLVPAPLIEFRYYTIPFYFLILHSKIGKTSNWLLIGCLYAVVNIFTMYLFLFRPFHWDHEPGTQRFIW
ncbi:dol-P-Glc:Glc(2)Man(9)GlcNAc(2)-PP-Dol alpha-1,2-glucosyltransferase isoform X3 [Musa acuminata AAA Group]|uniref:dol-P-Glc:Glc(2)Man(9)GlcNAc(2)-PP-Dol alpha-1,2-glucosyltransferase isoform X3 n=1 Tax=Musa acuminata AAA Group TaxID=214697 RepID=UPI0031E3870A